MYAPLYNPKTIIKKCLKVSITNKQKKIANEWIKKLKNNELKKEKENYFVFRDHILRDLLGYPEKKILYEKNNVEFSIDDEHGDTSVCFEAKGEKQKDLFARQGYEKKEQESPVIQTLSNMKRFPASFGVCTNYRNFILIDINHKLSKCHKFDFLTIENDDEKLREFIGIFSYENLVVKKTLKELYLSSVTEEREFTNEFYKLYHETRLMLIKAFQEKEDVTKDDGIKHAQLLLNRLIFIFFAEDKGDLEARLFTKRVLKILEDGKCSEDTRYISDNIVKLFSILDKGSKVHGIFGVNGGLFKDKFPAKIYFFDLKNPAFFDDVKQHSKSKKLDLDALSAKIIKKYQGKLSPIISNLLIMDSYDFNSEVNVNILGRVFEQSITDLEELKQEDGSRRKREGVFYTPEYITEYICHNTIIPHLSKHNATTIHELIREYFDNIEELEQKIKDVKILDPACGSGAFLVKAAEVLLEIDKEIQNTKPKTAAQSTLKEYSQEKEIVKIIEQNIFGVDINEESVEITKLSLFLKMASPNKKLINLSQNIKNGNSLIDNSNITKIFFDWNNEFKGVFAKGGFDIVIGNPPYGRYGVLSDEQKDYLKSKNYWGKTADISESFIRLVLDGLVKKGGFFSFIIPKGLSYVKSWEDTRKLLLEKCVVIKLIDASKAFEDVLYEQMIFVLNNKKYDYSQIEIGTITPDSLESLLLDREFINERVFLTGLDKEKIEILRKVEENSVPIKTMMSYWYGKGGMTPKINTEQRGTKLLTGKEITRYGFNLEIEPWYLADKFLNDVDKQRTEVEKVVVQDIVAHITKPVPHIKLTASLDSEKRFCLNTVMSFSEMKDGCSNKFVLALINSKFLSFYYYFFIFNQAIRTMHFMPGYSDYIPIPKDYKRVESKINELSSQMFDLTTDFQIHQNKFFTRLKTNFGLTRIPKKLERFYHSDFNAFMNEISKMKINIPLKKQDELQDYFIEYKSKLFTMWQNLESLNGQINEQIYELYGLNNNEIKIIENHVPI